MKNQRAFSNATGRVSLVGLMVVASAVLASPAHAGDKRLSNAMVKFTASSSTGLKIVGTSTEVRFENRGPSLIFKVPLGSMTTGLGTRDRQVRDRYLEADTHPSVNLHIARDALKIPKTDGVVEGDVIAKLVLHGKSRDTTVHYSLERQGGSLRVQGTFRIDLRAHNIDLPSYRGMTIHPEVEVEVAFGALDRAVVADSF